MNKGLIPQIYNSLKSHLKKIPLEYSLRLSQKYEADIYFKREDLQFTRSFKIRGALYKILKEYQVNKNLQVVCASAGNHAQGVSYACNLLDIEGDIFVPGVTPLQKKKRIEYFGEKNIKLHVSGNNLQETFVNAIHYSQNYNKTFIHPFDDPDIILGQSTLGYEIIQEIEPDYLISCVGGGGLISGLSLSLPSTTKIIGAEPILAPSMSQALITGKPVKIDIQDNFVDGATVSKIGKNNYDICKNILEGENAIKLITNEHICHELINCYQEDGIILEPAGVLSVCALEKMDREEIRGKKIVCILSGGNNDITRYPEIMEKNLLYLNRKHYYIIEFAQKPKQLKKYILNVLGENDDITRFEYIKKTNTSMGNVLIGLETQNNIYIEEKMKEYNFKFQKIEPDDLIFSYLI